MRQLAPLRMSAVRSSRARKLALLSKLTLSWRNISETFNIDGPGGTIRFGVGSPGSALSGVWRVWSNKQKNDIYFAARQLAGIQKVSLHDGGEWRYQWTNPRIATKYGLNMEHPIHRWNRPASNEAGWTRALIIAVPPADLVEHPYPEDESKPILWVPQLVSGYGVMFQIVVARPDEGVVNSRGLRPAAAYRLENGEICLLLAGVLHLTPENEQEHARLRSVIRAQMRSVGIEPTKSIRICGWGPATDDGTETIWDLSVWSESDTAN